MAGSLLGKFFYICYNNGVASVISEEVYATRTQAMIIRGALRETAQGQIKATNYALREDADRARDAWSDSVNKGLAHISETPIFTFTVGDRVARSAWFTGSSELLALLREWVKSEGGAFREASFYVPFSNGCELGMHGLERVEDELKYVTTHEQFEKTFGVRYLDLVAKLSK
jgi:hypothetical protein